jgi:hypothetical protein
MLRYMASWPLEVTITTGLLLLLDLGLVHKCVGNPWRALLSLRRARSFLDHLGFHSVGEEARPRSLSRPWQRRTNSHYWSNKGDLPSKSMIPSNQKPIFEYRLCVCAVHAYSTIFSVQRQLSEADTKHTRLWLFLLSFIFFLGSGYA